MTRSHIHEVSFYEVEVYLPPGMHNFVHDIGAPFCRFWEIELNAAARGLECTESEYSRYDEVEWARFSTRTDAELWRTRMLATIEKIQQAIDEYNKEQ